MPLVYDASVAAVPQSGNWQCSAAAAAWLLRSLGVDVSQDDVVAALGPGRIDQSVGLHDHTGAGLAAMLSDTYGVAATNGGPLNFDEALARAASGPLLLGGDAWDHWSGVRGADGALELANPSPGWQGVGQTLNRDQFAALGPFYGVWPTDIASAGGLPSAGMPRTDGGLLAGVGLPSTVELAAGAFALLWALDLLP